MMSCLLPQFKCSPDAFAVKFKSPSSYPVHSSKSREAIDFQAQCILSTTSTPVVTGTEVSEFEKLHLASLESILNGIPSNGSLTMSMAKTAMLDLEKLQVLDNHPIPAAADKLWAYARAVGHLPEVNLGATHFTSEEAVVTAAASEVLDLAKAAFKVAKDAAMMVSHSKSTEFYGTMMRTVPKVSDSTSKQRQLIDHAERVVNEDSEVLGNGLDKNHPCTFPFAESTDVEPSVEGIELEPQHFRSITVRSKRQTERKAKRSRAAEKAAVNFVSIKPGSSGWKKRPSVKDLDYSDPLRFVRVASSTSKLLTTSEEQELSEGIQVLLKLERLHEQVAQRCGNQPTFAQWASAAGIDQKTLRKQINYGIICKDKLVKSNMRLVISIAKKFQGTGMNLQDLVQEGCRGLVRGAEKFDASKGFKFSTYAHWWIKQAVRRSLSDRCRTIRLPFHMVEATYRVKEAKRQLYSEYGRHPDDEELAKATGLSMKRISAVMLTPKPPRSLDQKIGFNQDLKPSDVISDPEAETAEKTLIKEFMRRDLAKVLDTLNPREKQVIKFRFGLDDNRMRTLREIGELMGVSRERIRQIESSAFRKLKSKKRTKLLQQYMLP